MMGKSLDAFVVLVSLQKFVAGSVVASSYPKCNAKQE